MDADRSRKVSAIIPAYNAEAYLAQAIESVLGQTHQDVECIVVDDGSSDRTAEVARGYGDAVTLISQRNAGVSAARNRGAAQAGGAFVAFLDADDRWRPRRLEAQLETLAREPALEAVVCATQVVDRELAPRSVMRQDAGLTPRELLLCRASLVSVSSNLLIARTAFDAIGGFDETLSTSADWALMFRLVERGRLGVLDEPLVEYRVHDTNMSSNVDLFARDMLAAFDGLFARPDVPSAQRRLRRRAYANLHRMIAGSYFVNGAIRPFARHALRSLASHPSTLPYFAGLPLRRLRAVTSPRA